jgi:hypothetical protein
MAPPTNLIVFRDTGERISGRALVERLRDALRASISDRESLIGRLIIAGQVESALADCGAEASLDAAAITDSLAHRLFGIRPAETTHLLSLLGKLELALPKEVAINHPEGFAYYGLHPADFAGAATSLGHDGPAAIIGVRSVGTTLSAVGLAALAREGIGASRITVRPVGHPYDRQTTFTNEQRSWVDHENRKRSSFMIVDEGPGLSGSSFISVAEALEALGVAANRITLVGTHDVDPNTLCAPEAARRWKRYKWKKAESSIGYSYANEIPLSGGLWRNLLLQSNAEVPACWPEMESIKFLSPDRQHLSKFEGLGQHGERARQRGSVLFEAGFGPQLSSAGQGTSRYAFVSGTPLQAFDLSSEVLDRIASYCAFRSSAFAAERQSDTLDEMVRFNFSQEFGSALEIETSGYACEAPVIVDARMQPYKWIRLSSGEILKVDGSADGEGHFLPGPTDIAWDLAGAIVEWNMNRRAEEYLISEFRKCGGRTSGKKITSFVLAYSLFRMSFCKMALASTQNEGEKPRLQRAFALYRAKVEEALRRFRRPHSGSELHG